MCSYMTKMIKAQITYLNNNFECVIDKVLYRISGVESLYRIFNYKNAQYILLGV